MSSSKVSLKLLIDTKAHKVLFAEAGKDFVDFLFNILSLPVGTVVRLLANTSMIGSLGNLYESVENLNETYMQSKQSKETLLKPQAPSSSAQVALLLTVFKWSAKQVGTWVLSSIERVVVVPFFLCQGTDIITFLTFFLFYPPLYTSHASCISLLSAL